jgi:hypothetical protein
MRTSIILTTEVPHKEDNIQTLHQCQVNFFRHQEDPESGLEAIVAKGCTRQSME